MTRPLLLLLCVMLLSGCEALNEAVVRQMFKDRGVSRKLNIQILEGLEKRNKEAPAQPALRPPPFLDQG